MKTYRYRVTRPNGEMESLRVPTMFDPHEVARKLSNSLVFLHVPANHSAFVKGPFSGKVEGPAWVLVHEGEQYGPLEEPRDDAHAYRLLDQCGAELYPNSEHVFKDA